MCVPCPNGCGSRRPIVPTLHAFGGLAEPWPSSTAVTVRGGLKTQGLEDADPTPLLPSSAALRGWDDLIQLSVARADSRAAYPCPLSRRFGEAAWSPGE